MAVVLQLKMPPRPSSSLLLVLLLSLPGGGTEECRDAFRTGRDDFVLDVKGSVQDGATLLATAYVSSRAECESLCCGHPRCNLALLEPRAHTAATDNRTCDMFDCVYGNRFVCGFANQVGYQSYVREPVFAKYLDAAHRPGESGRHEQINKQCPSMSCFCPNSELRANSVTNFTKKKCYPLL